MTVDRLGKYEVRGVLGKGAMGTVYEGWDPHISRKVAIKTVPIPDPSDTDAQDELTRFRREAQAAGRLSHPNIVGVFDYGETGELAYIVMEYVDGRTLKSLLDGGERVTLPVLRQLMTDTLAGLEYSHQHGVVHRDIKPGNVIVVGDTARAKLADFGIARIESSNLTQVGTIMGTPAYMSPEQFMGETSDARTDIYSAGVLLFQLLTGERPFEGGMSTIMHKALNTTPPKPSDLSVTAPAALDAVVARAMARRPEDRFATAAAFAQSLNDALDGKTVIPDADATLIQAPAAKPAVSPPSTTPTELPRRSRAPLFAGAALIALAAGGAGAWFALHQPPAPPTLQADNSPPPSTAVAAPQAVPSQAAPTPPAPQAPPPLSANPVQPPTSPAAAKPADKLPPVPTAPSTSPPPPLADVPTARAAAQVPVAASTPKLETAESTAPAPSAVTTPPIVGAAPPPTETRQSIPSPVQPPAAVSTPSPTTSPATTSPATTTPAATPPLQTAAAGLSPEALREAVTAAIRGADCATIGGAVAGNGEITLRGVVGSGAPMRDLMRDVREAAPTAPLDDAALTEVQGPYCGILNLVRAYIRPFGTAGGGVEVGLKNGRNSLVEDEEIEIHATAPVAAYLQLDYFSGDGSLMHFRTASQGSPMVPARAPQVFSGAAAPPFGTDLIVAIASSTPLFANKKVLADTVEPYVAELRAALDAAHAHHATLSASVIAVHTSAK